MTCGRLAEKSRENASKGEEVNLRGDSIPEQT
jgi:hypothetical protein